jgi:hypothetical protein
MWISLSICIYHTVTFSAYGSPVSQSYNVVLNLSSNPVFLANATKSSTPNPQNVGTANLTPNS